MHLNTCLALAIADKLLSLVNRPNFGLCLDTFQITGREWADPSEPDGLLAGFASAEERNAALTKSLNELSTTIPGECFYFSGQACRRHMLK